MSDNRHHADYRIYETPKKRRLTFYLYLILLIVILAVLGVNQFAARNAGDTVDNNDVQTVSRSTNGSGARGLRSSVSSDPTEAPVIDPNALTDYENAVIAATERAMPAVVSIHVSGTQYVVQSFRDPLLRMLYGNQVARKPINGMGSGVIIHPDGIIITNDHVINVTNEESIDFEKTSIEIEVMLSDGRTYDARVIKHFPVQDIAIIDIDAENMPYVELGDSDKLKQGQTVIAIGNPFGDALTGGLLGSEPSVSKGIVSALRRNLSINTEKFTRYYRKMIQTDAAINEGNSGGALIDLKGRLVGINTAILSPSGTGSIGIGFAFPANRAKLILKQVREHGDIESWYTGIKVQNLENSIAKTLGYEGPGVLTAETELHSPGEKSGLKRGDIIVKVDGFIVTSPKEIVNIFHGAIPGENVELTVFRDRNYRNLTLEVGSAD